MHVLSTTELPAIVAIVSGRVVDRQGRMYNLAIHCVAVAASPTRRSLLTETANSEQLLYIVAAVRCCTLFYRLGPVVRPYSSHGLWTRLLVCMLPYP